MSLDANKVIERLQAQLGSYVVEIAKRDVLIEQLQARVTELETDGKVRPMKGQG